MNEGENSGMSNGPIFSSPNIAGSEPEKQQGPVPMPEQPVDVTKTDNPIVTTTLASMPGDEAAKPIVTSGGDSIDKKKPRFGLGTRRFKEKSSNAPVMQAAQPTAFANAPEFFNDAVGDIVLADAADAEKKNKTKKFIIIGAIVGVVLIVLVVGIVTLAGAGKGIASSELKKAFYSFANMYFYGTEKEDGVEELAKDKTAYAWTHNQDSAYADKLKTKYSKFVDYYRNNKSEKKLGSIPIELDERLSVLDARHRYTSISSFRQSELAYTQTLEKAKSSIEAEYKVENVSSLARAVLDYYKDESLIDAEIYNVYAKHKCIKNATVQNKDKKEAVYFADSECVVKKIPADEKKKISELKTEKIDITKRKNLVFDDTEIYLNKTIINIGKNIEGRK